MKPQKNTHPEDLKASIRKTNRSLEGLSVELGFSPSAVGIALRRRWHDVRVGIAKHLDTPIQQLWPEDYHPDGEPKLYRPKKTKAARAVRRRQKQQRELAA